MTRRQPAGRAALAAVALLATAGLIGLLVLPGGDAAPPGSHTSDVSAAPPAPDGNPFEVEATARGQSDLPHTQLPLRLVATVLRERRSLSLATVEDTAAGGHEVLSEGDLLRHHPRVRLTAIERGRVLLDNDGTREQLQLDRSKGASGGGPDPEEVAYRRDLSRRLRTLTDAGTEYRDVLGGGRRSGLILEGDVSPVFEGDELVGVQLDALREGGVYDQVGLRNGDVVTAVNGVPLGDPTAAARVLGELAMSDLLEVSVEHRDGTADVLSIPTSEFKAAVDALGSPGGE
jgi:general secretion pathway protein C